MSRKITSKLIFLIASHGFIIEPFTHWWKISDETISWKEKYSPFSVADVILARSPFWSLNVDSWATKLLQFLRASSHGLGGSPKSTPITRKHLLPNAANEGGQWPFTTGVGVGVGVGVGTEVLPGGVVLAGGGATVVWMLEGALCLQMKPWRFPHRSSFHLPLEIWQLIFCLNLKISKANLISHIFISYENILYENKFKFNLLNKYSFENRPCLLCKWLL